MKNDSIPVLRRSLLYVIAMLLLFGFSAAMAGQPEAWKADWDKTVEAAKKDGQIVLYGSADFETLYAEFHKKYPEIRVTGVFGRGADVAKRLMSERRVRSRRFWSFRRLPTSRNGGRENIITSIRKTSTC